MPENVTKRLQVTFKQGLPMGTRAEFKHDGERWIAYPHTKNAAIMAALDRLIGIHSRIEREMVRWINERPTDAALVTRVLDMTNRAQALRSELAIEKIKAVTL